MRAAVSDDTRHPGKTQRHTQRMGELDVEGSEVSYLTDEKVAETYRLLGLDRQDARDAMTRLGPVCQTAVTPVWSLLSGGTGQAETTEEIHDAELE